MKEKLQAALEAIKSGDVEAAGECVSALKENPRTEDGLFELSNVDANFYEAARWVYPVYTAYETTCNKKEGYPDIVMQIHKIEKKLNQDYTFEHTACFMDMLIHVIDYMSPEIYEYYRELIDIFRANIKKAIGSFSQDGNWKAPEAESERNEALLRAAVKQACKTDVLLAEKYQSLC